MAIPTAVVPLSDIFELRRAVLRPGQPEEAAAFPEDADPDVFHIAAYDGDRVGPESVAACVTFFPDSLKESGGMPGYRFRGLASAERVRGLGFGHAVLEAGIEEVRERGIRYVWCNGRVAAAAFYAREGFVTLGEEFLQEPAGRHYHYVKFLKD